MVRRVCRIGRALDANAHPAKFDLDDAGVLMYRSGPVFDNFGDLHRHELRRRRLQIQPAFAKQFPPVEGSTGSTSTPSPSYFPAQN
jgi:hypothetical protein